jgi:hypothetical protein
MEGASGGSRKDSKGKAQAKDQELQKVHTKPTKPRGAKKRTREQYEHEQQSKQQAADVQEDEFDPRFDDEPIDIVVAKGDGEVYDRSYPVEATVGDVKDVIEAKWGLKREQQHLYLDHEEREEHLKDDSEGIRGMRQARDATVTMSVLMHVADMQAEVPKLVKEGAEVLGDGQRGAKDDQFRYPSAIAWVPSQPDWLATTEFGNHRVEVTNGRAHRPDDLQAQPAW